MAAMLIYDEIMEQSKYLKNITSCTVDKGFERILFIVVFIAPNIVTLSLRNTPYLPSVFVAMNLSQTSILVALAAFLVGKDLKDVVSEMVHVVFFRMVPFVYLLSSVLHTLSLVLFDSVVFLVPILSLKALSAICFLVGFLCWLQMDIKWDRKDCRTLLCSTVCISYILVMVATAALTKSFVWKNANSSYLVTMAYCTQAICLAVTVYYSKLGVHGAAAESEVTELKRLFVRYISHELRSPLNIVHAGLDLLKSEVHELLSLDCMYRPGGSTITGSSLKASGSRLQAQSLRNNITELLDDIFHSSDSAVGILNDILQYEQIDTGSFHLDKSWRPLFKVLEGKLAASVKLARKSEVNLIVEDFTIASEYGVRNFFSQWVSSSMKCSPSTDGEICVNNWQPQLVDETACTNLQSAVKQSPMAKLVLDIDVYKVDQVIKTLVNNAVKHSPPHGTVKLKVSCILLDSLNENQARIVAKMGVDAVGVFRVEVTDSAVGISESSYSKVFDENDNFNTTNLQGVGEAGLGLFISRRIINMHNGRMGHSSNAGSSSEADIEQNHVEPRSTCYFELPLYSSESVHSPGRGIQYFPALLSVLQRHKTRAVLPDTISSSEHTMTTLRTRNSVLLADSFDGTSNNFALISPHQQSQQQYRQKRRRHNSVSSPSHSFSREQSTLPTERDISDVPLSNGSLVDVTLFESRSSRRNSMICTSVGGSFRGDVDTVGGDHLVTRKSFLAGSDRRSEDVNRLFYSGSSKIVPVSPKQINRMDLEINTTLHTSLQDLSDFEEVDRIPLRMLIVDDSPLNRKIIVRIIESDLVALPECIIMEADDGESALTIMRQEQTAGRNFDFVLMDYVMLKLHGPETASIMRNRLGYSGVIIGVTGNALPEDLARFVSCGANQVITKPLTKAKLLDTLLSYTN